MDDQFENQAEIDRYEDKHDVQGRRSMMERITSLENIIQLQTDKAKADFQAIENMQKRVNRLSEKIELLQGRVYALEQATDAQDHVDTIESNRPGLY